ncbi:alginate O-acetyltransferase AlgX-related protein [Desulfovibrio sp. TomC]|uniref:alginate O-acetyltransferase AlgX-related protein n=1 Tax=Desulfovibrio sp. TomC TaxID=1562888 RepID=UPI0005BD73DA|nr:hypothetical protein [Desulfovibrio sp. TomC]
MRNKCLLFLAGAVLLVGLGELACRLFEQAYYRAVINPTGDIVNLTALNYNDTTVPRRKTPGEFRILEFGDSYVYGTVKTDYTPSSVAANLLGQAGAPTRLVNLSEPGTSFFQYRKAMRHWAGLIEADALVVGMFLGNDCVEVARHIVPDDLPVNGWLRENFVEITTGRKRLAAARHGHGLRLLDYAADAINIKATGEYVTMNIPEPHSGLYSPLPEERFMELTRLFAVAGEPAHSAELARGWQALADTGRDLARFGRERGMRVAVVLSPAEVAVNDRLWRKAALEAGIDPKSFDPTLPGRMAAAVLAKVAPDVAVLDLTPVFACAAARGDVLYPPREIHWNAAGNRLAGQALARFVGRTWLGLPGDAPVGADPCLDAAPLPAGPADMAACLAAAGPFAEPARP